ncbi:MAG: hypothetical protein VB018_13275 [Lachnospiraceae bacterium]|nr:hypothetical protein [Lachnospiraceae bacterium]
MGIQGISGLNRLGESFDRLLESMPDKRRQLHEAIADKAVQEVHSDIDKNLNDNNDKIKGWQEGSVGSGGGYAAVRAIKGETGANSPGAITNYLESGHAIRRPRVDRPMSQRRVKMAAVAGRGFYADAKVNAEAIAIGLCEQFAEDLARGIGNA